MNKNILHKMKSTILHKSITAIVMLFILLNNSSCKKDESSNSSTGESMISVNINPVEDFQNLQKIASTSPRQEYITLLNDMINVDNNFSVQVFGEEETIASANKSSSKYKSVKQAATTPLNDGVKYVILLYIGNQFQKSAIGTVGTPLQLSSRDNTTYTWYAYSYNNGANIPLPSDTNAPLIPTGNEELLFATGTFITTSGVKDLPITFKHQLGKLKIRLSSENLYAKIQSITSELTGDYIKKGNLNLKTGNIQDFTSVNQNNNIIFTVDPTDDAVYWAEFVTAEVDLSAIEMRFTELTVKYINTKVIQEIGVTNILQTLNQKLTANTFNNIKGKVYTSYVNLLHKISPKAFAITDNLGGADNEALREAFRNVQSNNINGSNVGNSIPIVSINVSSPIQEITNSSALTNFLRASNTASSYPDILIVTRYSNVNSTNAQYFKTFVDKGGYVLMYAVDEGSGNSLDILNAIFPQYTMAITANGDGSTRRTYALPRASFPGDSILDGPFNDALGLFKRNFSTTDGVYQDLMSNNWRWGTGSFVAGSLSGIPDNEIIAYTRFGDGDGTFTSSQNARRNNLTMYRHKKKHIFHVLDRNFLRGDFPPPTGQAGPYNHPYQYDATRNFFPVPRKNYGPNNATVMNSTIFWNAIAWALINSEFYGPNINPKFQL